MFYKPNARIPQAERDRIRAAQRARLASQVEQLGLKPPSLAESRRGPANHGVNAEQAAADALVDEYKSRFKSGMVGGVSSTMRQQASQRNQLDPSEYQVTRLSPEAFREDEPYDGGRRYTNEEIFGQSLSDEGMARMGISPGRRPYVGDMDEVGRIDIVRIGKGLCGRPSKPESGCG